MNNQNFFLLKILSEVILYKYFGVTREAICKIFVTIFFDKIVENCIQTDIMAFKSYCTATWDISILHKI